MKAMSLRNSSNSLLQSKKSELLDNPSLISQLDRNLALKELRLSLGSSQTNFTKYFFRVRGEVFIPGDHHQLINDTLLKLERGELRDEEGRKCNNLLINLPPRFGKTQFCVIDWIARCLALNPKAKFIHLSYSDELALDNSAKARETVALPEYQELWPVKIKSDSDSKKKWYTTQGGGVYATAAGGAVTGFGAGSLADIADGKEPDEFSDFFAGEDAAEVNPNLFYGAIIIDDPIKVEDAESEKERERVNHRLNSTIKSRRNSRNTPIVIIMQRLHEDDMAGFVLSGGMEERFYHLNIPAADLVNETSTWPAKHTYDELMKMKTADHTVFMSQYMQDPTPDEGVFFKAEWFSNTRFRLGQEPTRLVKYGAGDYAVTEDAGDWTEQAIGGFDITDDLWFLDWRSARVTLDKSIDTMVQLVIDHDPVLWAAESGVIRRAMEPFVLKEQQRRRMHFKLEWLPATRSKAMNAKSFQALCAQGKVHIPYGQWGDDLIAQLLKFTGKDDKIDDKVDVCGLFGRVLAQAFGPTTYHENLNGVNKDDYGLEDEDDEYGSGNIPIV